MSQTPNRAAEMTALTLAALALVGSCKRGDRPSHDPPADDGAPAAVSTSDVEPSAQPAQVILDDLVIRVAEGSPPVELYTEQLAQYLGRQLAGSGYFFALVNETDPMQPARRARISALISYQQVDVGSAGKPALVAAVELTATWVDASSPFLRENLITERVLDPAQRDVLAKVTAAHVAKTVEEAGAGLIAQEKVRSGTTEALLAVLSAEATPPGLIAFALGELSERKPPGAVDVAARHLSSEHPIVRDRAITTLVALGDPAAIDPLTKMAAFDDPAAMRTIIEAVSALGGPDARDYLDFLATGHPDPEIKDRAAAALRGLAPVQGR